MELYGQDPELRLLSALVARLESSTVMDVGAERGAVVDGMLLAGVSQIHAFDPHPENVTTLLARFGTDPRVTVHPYALSDRDGDTDLHVSSGPDGKHLSFGHTLLQRGDTEEITWRETITVARRSIESLVTTGELAQRVGILKIDTEGHDLAVVQGMGPLEADVVMVEHWNDLPNGLGVCPWRAEDMTAALEPRGFSHYAFIVHRGEFVTLKWDDAQVERGAMGNLVFVHDHVLDRVLGDLLTCAGSLAEQAVQVGRCYAQAAGERLGVIEGLEVAAETRLCALEETSAALALQRTELEALRERAR